MIQLRGHGRTTTANQERLAADEEVVNNVIRMPEEVCRVVVVGRVKESRAQTQGGADGYDTLVLDREPNQGI